MGLLQAYHRVARENTPDARLEFGYWELRCRLVATRRTVEQINLFAEAFAKSGDRKVAEDTLLEQFRRDLGIV